MITRIVGVPLIAGLSFEVIKWAGRNRRRPLGPRDHVPGHAASAADHGRAGPRPARGVDRVAEGGARAAGRHRASRPRTLSGSKSWRRFRPRVRGTRGPRRDRRRRVRRPRGGDRAPPARVHRRDACSSGRRASAGPGATTTTRGVPATSRAICTRSHSRSAGTGRGCARRRAEILRYLEEVARDERRRSARACGVDVVSCRWDDASSSWTVSCADGRTWGADAVVIATGQLHQPSVPRLEGIDEFGGREFSLVAVGSLRRPRRQAGGGDRNGRERGPVRARGRPSRRGVCTCSSGPATGSCRGAIGRTRGSCAPRSASCPGVQAFRRRFVYYYAETLTMMIRNPRTVGRVGRLRSALFMRWQLRDPEVRRKAWPDYTFGCKRVLFSSHYLPALQRPNVELVTSTDRAAERRWCRDRGRGGARGRLRDLGHGVQDDRVHVPDGDRRRRRAVAARGSGRPVPTPISASASPGSRRCS